MVPYSIIFSSGLYEYIQLTLYWTSRNRSKNLSHRFLSSSSLSLSSSSASSISIESVCSANCTISTSLFLSDTNETGSKSDISKSSIISSTSDCISPGKSLVFFSNSSVPSLSSPAPSSNEEDPSERSPIPSSIS